MKKQSFISGALLLAVATALGKIFSAIFKIPLDRFFLQAEGMAVFNGAYNVYMFFFTISGGIALAVSHMVASASSKEEEDTITSTAIVFITAAFSLTAGFFMLFSGTISDFIGLSESRLAFIVMAPALIFCGMWAPLKGYFQGRMTMVPSAAAQASDSFAKLLFGIIGAYVFMSFPIGIKAAGAISGVPFAALVSFLILAVSAKKVSFRFHFNRISACGIIKRLIVISIPLILASSMHPILNLIDTISVVPSLTYAGAENARYAFGCLSRAAMLYSLPAVIASSVASGILPSVTESLREGKFEKLRGDASLALRLALIISVPCSAGFMAIPKDILSLLFDDPSHSLALVLIAPSSVLLSVSGTLSSILQAFDKVRYTMLAAISAIVTKLILNVPLLYFFGVNGSSAATTISFLVMTALLVYFVSRHTVFSPSVKEHAAKPFICGIICFISAIFSGIYLPAIPAIIIAAVFYIPSVFFTHLIRGSEISQIFSAEKSM